MGTQIQTWQVTFTGKSPPQDTCSLLQGVVSWQSKLQKVVAISTTEAEYISATKDSKELLWTKKFLKELSITQEKYSLHYDSQSAINLSKNVIYHSRTAYRCSLSEMLWRTVWCRLSRLTKAGIHKIWWWDLYQRKSMSSAGVWQAWFQFEDPLHHEVGGRDWWECLATWWKDSSSTACIHASLFVYHTLSCRHLVSPSIEREIGNLLDSMHLFGFPIE